MRFNIGDKVRVIKPYSGGNFEDGDIVEIVQIGDEDFECECYGAISPYDNDMWFLDEEEVAPVTNADMIRHMNDEELADFFNERVNVGACSDFGITHNRECDSNCLECIKEWLQALVNID